MYVCVCHFGSSEPKCAISPQFIRINSVSPGFIKVFREEKTIEEAGDTMSQDILYRTPMGRWGDADEVAAAIYFLADSESSYITGAVVPVDGGWSLGGASTLAANMKDIAGV